jgi:hypothetical protein
MVKRISLRLPDGLHGRLKAEAEAGRRSLHGQILWRLEQPLPEERPDRADGEGEKR